MVQADPGNAAALAGAVAGQDAVIYALGFRGRGEVSFFSATTKALIAAMQASGPQRLIAITGVGAGDTKGHGGFFYDHLIYPLFTKNLYADKDRQEALVRASRLDWTILRPAPFKTRPGNEPFHILTAVAPGTRLSSVTPAEVAGLALDCADRGLLRPRCRGLGPAGSAYSSFFAPSITAHSLAFAAATRARSALVWPYWARFSAALARFRMRRVDARLRRPGSPHHSCGDHVSGDCSQSLVEVWGATGSGITGL
jgi:hypothetical protein